MADLTADQLSDLQADLGVIDDGTVWTNIELNRLWARAGENYNATILLALRQLYIASLKENDYTAGQTSEKRSQLRQGLLEAIGYYEGVITQASQIQLIGLRSTPVTLRSLPYGELDPFFRERYFLNGRWYWREG